MAQVALYIGAFDAAALLLMGVVSAALFLFGVEAKMFWERLWPAVGILLATSVAAVLILLASTWISSILT
jgi:hypothetical protein